MDTDEGAHQLNLTPEILERLKQALKKKKSETTQKHEETKKTATISPKFITRHQKNDPCAALYSPSFFSFPPLPSHFPPHYSPPLFCQAQQELVSDRNTLIQKICKIGQV